MGLGIGRAGAFVEVWYRSLRDGVTDRLVLSPFSKRGPSRPVGNGSPGSNFA